MAKQETGGTHANKRGRAFENQVAQLLEDYGYQKTSKKVILDIVSSGYHETAVYGRQVNIGENIYHKDKYVDFLLFHPIYWRSGLVIECKWQGVGGSVEEKYPFETLNIQKHNYPTIIVLDGGGYSFGAEQWLKAQIDKTPLKSVLSLGELQKILSTKKTLTNNLASPCS